MFYNNTILHIIVKHQGPDIIWQYWEKSNRYQYLLSAFLILFTFQYENRISNSSQKVLFIHFIMSDLCYHSNVYFSSFKNNYLVLPIIYICNEVSICRYWQTQWMLRTQLVTSTNYGDGDNLGLSLHCRRTLETTSYWSGLVSFHNISLISSLNFNFGKRLFKQIDLFFIFLLIHGKHCINLPDGQSSYCQNLFVYMWTPEFSILAGAYTFVIQSSWAICIWLTLKLWHTPYSHIV